MKTLNLYIVSMIPILIECLYLLVLANVFLHLIWTTQEFIKPGLLNYRGFIIVSLISIHWQTVHWQRLIGNNLKRIFLKLGNTIPDFPYLTHNHGFLSIEQ